jgi:hypothetical protein
MSMSDETMETHLKDMYNVDDMSIQNHHLYFARVSKFLRWTDCLKKINTENMESMMTTICDQNEIIYQQNLKIMQLEADYTLTNNTRVFIHNDDEYEETLENNMPKMGQWIYFIKEHRSDDRIKIGRTGCLKQRLSSLQTGNSDKLYIVAYIKSEDTRALEDLFHNHFNEYRLNGEWFNITLDTVWAQLAHYKKTGNLTDMVKR